MGTRHREGCRFNNFCIKRIEKGSNFTMSVYIYRYDKMICKKLRIRAYPEIFLNFHNFSTQSFLRTTSPITLFYVYLLCHRGNFKRKFLRPFQCSVITQEPSKYYTYFCKTLKIREGTDLRSQTFLREMNYVLP